MSRTALIIVDFQNDYFPSVEGAKWPLDGAEAAAENGARLLAAFRESGQPIVHIRHEVRANEAPFFLRGSPGARIHASVAARDGEPVVVKHFPNSFRETNLRELLEEHDADSVVICGAMSNMCVDAITRAAHDMGYQCAVAHDACAACALEFNGVSVPADQVHAAFMAALAFGYAKVANTNELLAECSA